MVRFARERLCTLTSKDSITQTAFVNIDYIYLLLLLQQSKIVDRFLQNYTGADANVSIFPCVWSSVVSKQAGCIHSMPIIQVIIELSIMNARAT